MRSIIIQESEMSFGPFACSRVWEIEKSQIYKSIQQNIKIADFVFIKKNIDVLVFIVEVKSSAPKPESKEDFSKYIEDIKWKIINSLSICVAAKHQRRFPVRANMPAKLKFLDIKRAKFKLILVINGFQRKWLPPLQDALSKALYQTVKTWALEPTAVKVVNQNGAKMLGLML